MKLNQKMMEQAMKRMGIQAVPIDAEEVLIRTQDKEIVIRDPSVTRINAQGQESFQVAGEITERPREAWDPADAELVAQQTGASLAEAQFALKESNGDIAAAILRLKK